MFLSFSVSELEKNHYSVESLVEVLCIVAHMFNFVSSSTRDSRVSDRNELSVRSQVSTQKWSTLNDHLVNPSCSRCEERFLERFVILLIIFVRVELNLNELALEIVDVQSN